MLEIFFTEIFFTVLQGNSRFYSKLMLNATLDGWLSDRFALNTSRSRDGGGKEVGVSKSRYGGSLVHSFTASL